MQAASLLDNDLGTDGGDMPHQTHGGHSHHTHRRSRPGDSASDRKGFMAKLSWICLKGGACIFTFGVKAVFQPALIVGVTAMTGTLYYVMLRYMIAASVESPVLRGIFALLGLWLCINLLYNYYMTCFTSPGVAPTPQELLDQGT
ncbi:hypothetical protein KIPB_012762, partial [Kipferlia bialata]|eukprot:g12762.t1